MESDLIISRYYEHTTTQGERWDQLAYNYYGDALHYEPIIRANPHVAITPYLTAGIKLQIPIISADERPQERGELPPWRQ